MAGIIILCVIVLLFALVLLLPVGVRISYDRGELAASVRYGPVHIALYPRPEKAADEVKLQKEEKLPEPVPAQDSADAAPEKKKFSINADQILYTLEKLPPILGRALKRAGKRMRIEPLKVHLLVAGTDPADTARLYGKLEAALAGGLPVLHRLVRIREQDIQLFLDFQEEKMDCIADVGVSIRPWDVLLIALCAGGSALKWFLGFKKLADKPAASDTTEQTAPGTGAGAA